MFRKLHLPEISIDDEAKLIRIDRVPLGYTLLTFNEDGEQVQPFRNPLEERLNPELTHIRRWVEENQIDRTTTAEVMEKVIRPEATEIVGQKAMQMRVGESLRHLGFGTYSRTAAGYIYTRRAKQPDNL